MVKIKIGIAIELRLALPELFVGITFHMRNVSFCVDMYLRAASSWCMAGSLSESKR